jgi:hypothetical protein
VLYETLTGRAPLDRIECDPALREVFSRALARDPRERPASAGTVLDDARTALASAPDDTVRSASIAPLSSPGNPVVAAPRRRRWAWIPVGISLAVAAALAGIFWPRGSAAPRAEPTVLPHTLTVCAQHLTVRRDPLTERRTHIVATLAPGDSFVVEATKGQGWVYGHSSGSVSATGWALHQWLRTDCRAR